MRFHISAFLGLTLAVLPGIAHAQACPETVDGQSMADLMTEQGGAEQLYEYTLAGTVMYEVFIEDLEADLADGGPDPEIEASIAALRAEYKTEHKIMEAALCHMRS